MHLDTLRTGKTGGQSAETKPENQSGAGAGDSDLAIVGGSKVVQAEKQINRHKVESHMDTDWADFCAKEILWESAPARLLLSRDHEASLAAAGQPGGCEAI